MSAAAPLSGEERAAIALGRLETADDGHDPSAGYFVSSSPPPTEPPWPVLAAPAWHGPIGAYARAADRFTEADPVAVLVSLLVGFGAACGAGPHTVAGNDHHAANLFAVVTGKTSKGGKGTSWAVARAPLEVAAPEFMAGRVLGGFGSGEALVDEVRDANGDDDPGADDKRLLLYETEYARVLKVAGREGSTLSMVVRDAWDGRRLQARSRARKSVATGHHIAAVAHVTAAELRARLTDVETYGGTANRFMFVLARRSKRLPAGGNVPSEIIDAYGHQLGEALAVAWRRTRLGRTPAAERRWAELYDELGDDDPGGLLGAVIARAEPTALRLSLVYALADGAAAIDVAHVEAARALWRYARASAEWLFGDATGDVVADRLLDAIRAAGTDGLSLEEQSDTLGRNVPAARLKVARHLLEVSGLIATTTDPTPTGGRPRTVSVALTKKDEFTRKGPSGPP